MAPHRVDFLYTEIGRGHAHYLDGIRAALPESHTGEVTSVQQLAHGCGRLGWTWAEHLYKAAGASQGIQHVYSTLRNRADYSRPGLLTRCMGKDVLRHYARRQNMLVVAHPVLAGLLHDRQAMLYQHGELGVPPEARLCGRFHVAVPDASGADAFREAGIPAARIHVTGLCIEPGLAARAHAHFCARIKRLEATGTPRHGLFISSGAEPGQHVRKLVAAARSALLAGGRTTIIAKHNGRLDRAWSRAQADRTTCLRWSTRDELNAHTQRVMADVDYFVSPAHERSQWALGLGLPMFIVDPQIGTFAPLNRDRLLEAQVGCKLDDPASFGSQLLAMDRNGELERMATAGWQRHPITGFESLATLLCDIHKMGVSKL